MLDLVDERNRDFMKAIGNVIRRLHSEGREVRSIEELSRLAAAQEAPRYYVTEEYALRLLRVLRNGKNCIPKGRRGAMVRELNEKVKVTEELTGLPLPDALREVLENASASCFFISENTAVRLAQRIQRERNHSKIR